jgi:hypothetical protein
MREDFRWTPQPQAAALIDGTLREFTSNSPWVRSLGAALHSRTGTRLVDWVDHFVLPDAAPLVARLTGTGFLSAAGDGGHIWTHPGGLFPAVVLQPSAARQLVLKVEAVADFLCIHRTADAEAIEGPPLAALRRARMAAENGHEAWIVERHGTHAWDVARFDVGQTPLILEHLEEFRLRRRNWPTEAEGFAETERLIREAVVDLGTARACDLFFQAEREYWQSRNRAARVQKARQDALGVGWANHDHHTYRSSRELFVTLIGQLELLGFECRERFYAGETAGWGAQVLEQPDCGVVIFADVDLSPDEVAGDFAHDPLPPRDTLGTVGLWCRLHGEAFLQAGMHHLECQFDFAAARDQLREAGVETMKPFTDLPYLKQAFTKGDIWPVEPRRIDAVLGAGLISRDEAERFRTSGALGSHLEILQRDDGYKGFNQTGIDEIIQKTDPRKMALAGA